MLCGSLILLITMACNSFNRSNFQSKASDDKIRVSDTKANLKELGVRPCKELGVSSSKKLMTIIFGTGSHGNDVKSIEVSLDDALLVAAFQGNVEAVKRYLEAGSNPVHRNSPSAYNYFEIAIENRNSEVVGCILERVKKELLFQDVMDTIIMKYEYISMNDENPLMRFDNIYTMIKYLLECGVNPSLLTNDKKRFEKLFCTARLFAYRGYWMSRCCLRFSDVLIDIIMLFLENGDYEYMYKRVQEEREKESGSIMDWFKRSKTINLLKKCFYGSGKRNSNLKSFKSDQERLIRSL